MKRILLLAVLIIFPLALFLLWPKVLEHFTTEELALAVVRQPREEVLILGGVKRAGTRAFSMQTLRIEEPGKESYRRLVTLDADRRIELTLNKPLPGAYRASLLLPEPDGSESSPETWLETPALKIDAGHSFAGEVRARRYHRAGLAEVAGGCLAAWTVLLGLCIAAWRSPGRRENAPPDASTCGRT